MAYNAARIAVREGDQRSLIHADASHRLVVERIGCRSVQPEINRSFAYYATKHKARASHAGSFILCQGGFLLLLTKYFAYSPSTGDRG